MTRVSVRRVLQLQQLLSTSIVEGRCVHCDVLQTTHGGRPELAPSTKSILHTQHKRLCPLIGIYEDLGKPDMRIDWSAIKREHVKITDIGKPLRNKLGANISTKQGVVIIKLYAGLSEYTYRVEPDGYYYKIIPDRTRTKEYRVFDEDNNHIGTFVTLYRAEDAIVEAEVKRATDAVA